MVARKEFAPSLFFDRVEDHLLAMLFSHLDGRGVARLAGVCSRWRDVVQGEGCDENIWKTLWRRDFEPFETDSPSATPLTGPPSLRLQYSHIASVDLLSNPLWKQVFPINGRRTVMDRQGSSAAVLNGCPVVYGGWTSGERIMSPRMPAHARMCPARPRCPLLARTRESWNRRLGCHSQRLVFLSIYPHIYIYRSVLLLSTYIHTYMYQSLSISIDLYVYMYTCIHTCKHAYKHTYIHTYIHTHIPIYL